MEKPDYLSYICARDYNSFIACADTSIHLFALSPLVEADHANVADRDRL